MIDLKHKWQDGERLIARYVADPNPMKPYVKELYTPSGVQVMLDSPPDHVHHHGLMFAVGADDDDFWSEKPPEKFGRQVPKETKTNFIFWKGKREGPDWGVSQELEWIAPGQKKLLIENRWVAVDYGARANVVSWLTDLKPAGSAPVKLWGRHYFGLGLRLIPDLNGKVKFIYPPGTAEGRVVRGDERLTSATWCAATGEVAGKPVTVAMFADPASIVTKLGDPQETRFPPAWFTMGVPFAYMGATLDLENRPMTLAPDRELKVHYGVALFDGIQDAATIETEYQAWCVTVLGNAPDGSIMRYKR